MIVRKQCGNCFWWVYTGLEDSGVAAVNGEGNWWYRIGDCLHEREHWCPEAGRKGIAEWLTGCVVWKKKTAGRN